MNIKLLNEHNLEPPSLKEGYTGSPESIHVKMPHCWKSHVMAQIADQTECDRSTEEEYETCHNADDSSDDTIIKHANTRALQKKRSLQPH